MTTIIYHKKNQDRDCPDGWAGAWVLSLVFPEATIIGCIHNFTIPHIADNEEVYIVDFSFSAEVLEKWADRGIKVTILDHHKGAMDSLDKANLSDRILKKFDLNECGATVAWKYFFPSKPIPAILSYIRDADLYLKELPRSEEITISIHYIGLTFQLLNLLAPLSQEELVSLFTPMGKKLLVVQKQRVKEIASIAKRKIAFKEKTLVFKVHKDEDYLISDICSYLYRNNPEYPFIIGYYINNQTYKVSFRSDPKGANYNVIPLAQQLGGNGHPNAAGATVDHIRWIKPLKEDAWYRNLYNKLTKFISSLKKKTKR